MQRFQCRECLHNGIVINRVSKGNMKSHLGMVHGMGPWGCSVCAYPSARREYVQAHLDKARRSGSQAGRHAQAVPLRSGAMSLALQHESDLCQLPHTVVWPNQAAADPIAPVTNPTIAPATSGPLMANSATVATSGNELDTLNAEDDEMDEDEADDLEPLPPTRSGLKNLYLIDTIIDTIHRATVIGRYYIDRIDDLLIPESIRHVVSAKGGLIEANPAERQHRAAMLLYYAIEELEYVEADLKAGGSQEDQLTENLAMRACEAISKMPVALTWYMRASTEKGNTEDDLGRLSMMHRVIFNKFDHEEDKEDEDEMQEDGGNC